MKNCDFKQTYPFDTCDFILCVLRSFAALRVGRWKVWGLGISLDIQVEHS